MVKLFDLNFREPQKMPKFDSDNNQLDIYHYKTHFSHYCRIPNHRHYRQRTLLRRGSS